MNVAVLVGQMLDETGEDGIPICWGSLRFKHNAIILMPRIFILGVGIFPLVFRLQKFVSDIVDVFAFVFNLCGRV